MTGGRYGQGWSGMYHAEQRRARRQRRVVRIALYLTAVFLFVWMVLAFGVVLP